MASFEVTDVGADGYGRIGHLSVPHGPVETPALFPVINLIGGTTEKSGGVWRRMREKLISADHLQGIMFQAMSFTDYGVSPDNLNTYWRTQTFHERFENLQAPVFIDSGGFKLMNSYRIKSAVAREQIEGADEFSREEALEYDSVTEQNVDRIKTLFYSPDIDGCVENLQLTECMASGAQGDTLSYVLLEALRSHLIEEVPTESVVESMFDRELPPAGEFDGTSIFLDF